MAHRTLASSRSSAADVSSIELARLVLAPESALIGDLTTTETLRARVDTDREEASRLIREADLLALPVVDPEDRVVGVITVDDAMEVLEAEATEDQARVDNVAS